MKKIISRYHIYVLIISQMFFFLINEIVFLLNNREIQESSILLNNRLEKTKTNISIFDFSKAKLRITFLEIASIYHSIYNLHHSEREYTIFGKYPLYILS